MSAPDDVDYGGSLGVACAHREPWRKRCVRCEIIWHEHCLATARRDVAKHEAKLAALRAEAGSDPRNVGND